MQIDGFSFTFQESFLKSYGFTILPCFYHVLLIFLVKMLTLVMLFLNGPIKGIFLYKFISTFNLASVEPCS